VIENLPAQIARGSDAAIRLDGDGVSRKHAEIYEREGILRIHDAEHTWYAGQWFSNR
jgi:pSer/pThr/pTyr-binding forkhead associated (FHA) protein